MSDMSFEVTTGPAASPVSGSDKIATDSLEDCVAKCQEAYDKCIADGNTESACTLAYKRCENSCE